MYLLIQFRFFLSEGRELKNEKKMRNSKEKMRKDRRNKKRKQRLRYRRASISGTKKSTVNLPA
jgi:hypothetical protein